LSAADPAPAPHDDDGRLATAEEAANRNIAPRGLFGWSAETRAKAEVLLIAAIALGGIVCMMAITAIVLVVHLRR
jgi:hypothetical protein